MNGKKNHFFNTTGPCNPEKHYMLAPEERLVGAQLYLAEYELNILRFCPLRLLYTVITRF